ncbi:MAG: hypothetical protein AAF547_18680 [Actinomycetota bacterium]
MVAACGSVSPAAGPPVGGEPTTTLAGEGLGSELADSLVQELDGRFLSIGAGVDGVEVVLAPDEEALAAELLARHGEEVVLSVGRLRYPLAEAANVCPEPPAERSDPDLSVAVVPPTGSISASGIESLELGVAVTNVGEGPLAFTTGSALGTILDPSGNVVSHGATAGLALPGLPVDLAPGDSIELPLYASMASCDPEIGFMLPPGDYLIVAEVVRSGDGKVVRIQSAPEPIRIGG